MTSCCMRANMLFFVIDTYTRRILDRMGVTPDAPTYAGYQQFFHQSLPADAPLYNEYHALLDRHAKDVMPEDAACVSVMLPARHVRYGT